MSISHYDVARRWVARAAKGFTGPVVDGASMFERGGKVYSWGDHFELGRPLWDKKKLRGFLLNGDRVSNSTTRHQEIVRRATLDHDTVLIPFSALEAAGVDLDTVRVVHRLQDRWEHHNHRSTEKPEGAEWHIKDVFEDAELTPEEIAAGRTSEGAHIYPGTLRVRKKTGTRQVLYLKNGWTEVRVTWGPDKRAVLYEWETSTHWLGESLIKARVTWRDDDRKTHHRWTLFLSGFDHQETTPLYFFCEMPYRCKARTVAGAYEALKPEPVKLAEQMGRSYTRQGDIFAVPAPTQTVKTLEAQRARLEHRSLSTNPRVKAPVHLPYILGTNHTATDVAYLPNGVTLARGVLYHDPNGRERDHARRRLGDGKTWHIVIKNTVPLGRR